MTSILQYFTKRIKFIYCLVVFLLYLLKFDCYCVTAKFDVELKNKCVPASVIITNQSTQGAGITYEWNFGQGSITYSSLQILEEVYTVPGHYTIKLKVTKGVEIDSFSRSIDVATGPVAKFTIDTTQGCVPFQVKLTNTSTSGSGIADVTWDFRNGDIRKGKTVYYTYSEPGTYGVLLTVVDSNGCSDYIESKDLIVAVDKPKADFSVTDSFACRSPLNVTFINKSTGQPGLRYKWDFGNGTTSTETNSSVAYIRTGYYSVKLVVTDVFNCTDSLIRKNLIRVGKLTGSIYARYENGQYASTAILCPGKITFGFSLDDQSDYTWKVTYKNNTQYFYNINKFTMQVADSGVLKIKLVYGLLSECPDSSSRTFLIDDFKADFSIDNPNGCNLPYKVNLSNLTKNSNNFTWELAGDSVSHNKDISYVIPRDSSYQTKFSHNSVHSEYTFTLMATNGNGCTSSISKNVTIDLPVARFMPDKVSGCVPFQVTFSDSSYSDQTIAKWIYKIGIDSTVNTTGSPVKHTFTIAGEYNVYLIIRTAQGCIDTSYNVKIIAGAKLSPDFTISPSNVCNQDTILLTGQSSLKDSIDWWHYSCPGVFNTGSQTSPIASIPINTDTIGNKNITLEVDFNGCISTITKNNAFTVKGPIGIFFETFDCDSPFFYTFVSGITPASSLEWKIDTATIDNKDSVNYSFTKSGNYVVQLTAVDNISHCTFIRKKTIPVRQVKAEFKVNPVNCLRDIIKFDAGLSVDYINNCYNEGFLWNFNDSSPPRRTYQTYYKYAYNKKGYYSPSLIVISDNGCSDTISKPTRITKPTASLTIDKSQGCTPQMSVRFTNTSTDNTILNWEWDFGDGNTAQNSSPVNHTYSSLSGREYTATLTVADSFNCKTTVDTTISLIKAVADFQATDNAICLGDMANFAILSGNVDSYKWNFGDGTTSNSSNSHLYNTSGVFDITLIARVGSCVDTITKLQYMSVEKANADFSVSDSSFKCYPATVTFNHFGSSSRIVSGIWYFGDGSRSTGYSSSPQYTYTRTGNFTATLWIKTLNNCQSTASKNIVITGPTADFSFSPNIICYGGQVSFQINSTQNVNETRWLFGDGETSDLPNPTHKYYSHGTIIPSLWVKNNDCETSISNGNIYISSITANFDFYNNRSSICLGKELIMNNRSRYYNFSQWKMNDVPFSDKTSISNFYPYQSGSYIIKLVVTDNYGCSDSTSKNLTIVPLPNFHITGDTSICKGIDSTHLSIAGNPTWSVSWTPASGLSNPVTFNPYAKPDYTTWYVALVTDTGGCASKDSIEIFVRQPSNVVFYPAGDTSINIGERIQLNVFTNVKNTTYQWSPNYRISCRTCSNPFVAPEQNTTYKVIVKDECFSVSKEFNIKVIINFFLEAPKAFTPNGDGNNDIFKFEYKNIKVFDLKIFNRWGNLIFTSNNPDNGWDGMYNGKLQNIDTYTYVVKAETGSGYKFERKGSFLLLK